MMKLNSVYISRLLKISASVLLLLSVSGCVNTHKSWFQATAMTYVPPRSAARLHKTQPYCANPNFHGYYATCWDRWPEGWIGCTRIGPDTLNINQMENTNEIELIPTGQLDDSRGDGVTFDYGRPNTSEVVEAPDAQAPKVTAPKDLSLAPAPREGKRFRLPVFSMNWIGWREKEAPTPQLSEPSPPTTISINRHSEIAEGRAGSDLSALSSQLILDREVEVDLTDAIQADFISQKLGSDEVHQTDASAEQQLSVSHNRPTEGCVGSLNCNCGDELLSVFYELSFRPNFLTYSGR